MQVTLFFVFVFVSTLGVEGGVFAWVCRRRIREKSRETKDSRYLLTALTWR
jgi:fatty-acid desaturase